MPSYLSQKGVSSLLESVGIAGQASTPLCCTKCITVFPGNGSVGLDSHQGSVLLFEAFNGRLLCILDAHEVTALRTAAASAVATKLLARQNALNGSDVAILGTGVQAYKHIEALQCVTKIASLRIWGRSEHKAEQIAHWARGKWSDLEVHTYRAVADAVKNADVICTLTPSSEPILESAWVAAGAHINAVGSCTPSHQELEPELVRRARVFVDTRAACIKEPGDLVGPLNSGLIHEGHILAEVGEVLMGKRVGREDEDQVTLFKSVGAAIEDLCTAKLVHDNYCLKRGQLL
eukprot:gene7537-8974_t